MTAVEVNFDGLVGPTHNYAGLSHGNVASMRHRGAVSNPREAALQGLAKMRALATMGVPQAVLPPQERPSVETLRSLGFGGDDRAVIASAAKAAPELLARCSSASSMWTANAATVAPSVDTADGRVHFTVANLAGNVHRSIEPPQTWRTLRAVFGDERHFAVHAALPSGGRMGDEGAANHTRLAPAPGKRGLHLFAYGHSTLTATADGGPSRFASRQALEASEAVARLHGLRERAVVFARQSPEAIDAGVFHNDVICVGHENVLFLHERAFVETRKTVAELRGRFAAVARGAELQVIEVPERRVPLADAVRSYLFNSQLVTVGRGRMALIVPADCRSVPRVWEYLEGLVGAGRTPIGEVHAFDLRQSMRNGGGPACLRLRVVLNAAERAAVAPGVFVDGTVHDRLATWVKKHYRDRLAPADLADPALLEESRRALDELTTLLGLGRSLYPFQR